MFGSSESYVHGSSNTPLIGVTIGRFLDQAAQRWGEREALVVCHQNVRWTYRELNHRANQFAAGLLALGLKPGDRVGIWAHNCSEWVLTQFATAKAGLILVNINPAYRRIEVDHALNKVGCKALITMTAFKTSDYIQILRDLLPELDRCEPGRLRAGEVPGLRCVIRLGDEQTPGMYNFCDIDGLANERHSQRIEEMCGQLQFDDPINIQFTSGTTGSPKGATLTHHNILNNGFFIGESMRLTEKDRLCIPVPLYHCFGMVLGNFACVTHGSAIVYPDQCFDPEKVLETVAAERCTGLHGVPTMFIAELNQPSFQDHDLSTLRTGIMAGSPCPIEVMRRVVNEMNLSQLTIAYGMTETSPVSFQSGTEDALEQRVSTVGRIHPHIEAKVIDPEGRLVPLGSPGELCTRGYSVMLGYWDDEELTREVVDPAGWMHTGDLAVIDDAGYCQIVGRLKDMVIRGGENIYPREIEEYLYRHPAIQEVQVVGVPDQKYGEELCAWVKLKPGADGSIAEEDIRNFCVGQIAHFKIPRYIKLVDAFPMTVTGKVQKYLMREQMIKELGMGEKQPDLDPSD